jgi:hypothetical protein
MVWGVEIRWGEERTDQQPTVRFHRIPDIPEDDGSLGIRPIVDDVAELCAYPQFSSLSRHRNGGTGKTYIVHIQTLDRTPLEEVKSNKLHLVILQCFRCVLRPDLHPISVMLTCTVTVEEAILMGGAIHGLQAITKRILTSLACTKTSGKS